MLPGSTYDFLLLDFINFLLRAFHFKGGRVLYTIMTMLSNIFHWHYFVLNYFLPFWFNLVVWSMYCAVTLETQPLHY